VAARLVTLDALRPHLVEAYASIAPTNNVATVEYKSSSLTAAMVEPGQTPTVAELSVTLTERMLGRRGEEIARGVCLVGPHRDDLSLTLGDLPTKGYASHGESWSTALALRLASFHLLQGDGVEPVLVLDDVFAELDETRRARLAELVAGAEQVLITAAVAADVPASLSGRRFDVQAATVVAGPEEGPDRHDG
jgi:DNA replication and repair protein RecF